MLLAGFISILHSLLEEYYWRWFIFGELKQYVPLVMAITLSSLAFMAHHVIVLYVFLPGEFLTAVVPFSLCIGVGGAEEIDPPTGAALVDAEEGVVDEEDLGGKSEGAGEGDALVEGTGDFAREAVRSGGLGERAIRFHRDRSET